MSKNDDFEIIIEEDKQEDKKKPIKYKELPSDLVKVNSKYISCDIKTELCVYMEQEAYEFIEKFAATDTKHELGGVIFGDVYKSRETIYIFITRAIEARGADSRSTSIKFTHEVWDYIYKKQAAVCPDSIMLGWFHTHPSFGIFLSKMDEFICENFFKQPHHVAYVVDPINDARGYYYWKNDKLTRVNGFYVYNKNKKAIPPVPLTPGHKETREASPKRLFYRMTAIFALITVSIILIWNNISLKNKMAGLDKNRTVLQQELTVFKNTREKENILRYHTVVTGDTLWRISEKYYGNNKWYDIIAQYNGIDESYTIYPEQKLRIKYFLKNASENK